MSGKGGSKIPKRKADEEVEPDSAADNKFYVDCPVSDAMWFVRALEFMGKSINSTIPLCFRGTGITVNMSAQQEKKKSSDGFILRGYLRYDQSYLPGYQLYSDRGDYNERCNRDKDMIAFGVDTQVLSGRFPKSALKSSSRLHLFSKSGAKNLYFKKDSDTQFTLKTVVGFVMETNPVPTIVIGNDSYEFSSKRPAPNVTMTIDELNTLCGDMKANENGILEIKIYRRGATFRASEYGNPDNGSLAEIGIRDKMLDKITMDVKFFSKLHGHIDKFSHGQSIVHIYFGRNNGAAVVTIVFMVGYSGHFLYQKEILQ